MLETHRGLTALWVQVPHSPVFSMHIDILTITCFSSSLLMRLKHRSSF